MQTKTRILVNTIVLYAKAIITTLIALISVPLVLRALGQSDYGLYNLVAGVIAMLSFLNASLTVSVQRFMSVSMGEGNNEKLNQIYNTGFSLHLLLGISIVLLLEVLLPLIFSGFLNIESNRIGAAQIVYQVLIISTFFTILSIPFNAVLNAHENLIVFAIIHIVESLLKLLIAIVLLYCPLDRLILYAVGMAIIAFLIFALKFFYIIRKYQYLSLKPRRFLNKDLFGEMLGFAGWNTMGSLALVGRNQGVAMVMNIFYGTIINAAYGIANQINGQLIYLSSTLQQAINPQLMKSEGMNDRSRLMRIAYVSCKFSVLVICLPAIPLIIEMPYVLDLWLRDIPNYTIQFSQLILVLSIFAQYSSGIQSAIQSVGTVRPYFITISFLLLLNIPASYFIIKIGYPPYYALLCFVIVECISLVARLSFAKKYVGISIREYIRKVILPTIATLTCACIPALILHFHMSQTFLRLLLVCIVYVVVYFIVAWRFALEKNEQEFFTSLLPRVKKTYQ